MGLRQAAIRIFRDSSEYLAFQKIIERMVREGVVTLSVNSDVVWGLLPEEERPDLYGLSENLIEIVKDEQIEVKITVVEKVRGGGNIYYTITLQ